MEKFGEARYNPDKFTGGLSGQKVLFQDQASPTIARGPCITNVGKMGLGVVHHQLEHIRLCIIQVGKLGSGASLAPTRTYKVVHHYKMKPKLVHKKQRTQ